MISLEREVTALRKKAGMADSECRRFEEEKQRAQVQGNKVRAAQMGWQVKQFSELMHSFHREGDLRLFEVNNERHRQEVASIHVSASQVEGSSWSMPFLPPPQPIAITVGGPSRRSASPLPCLIPPPEDEPPPRSAISKGKQPKCRAQRILASTDKDGNSMMAGSVSMGTHHRGDLRWFTHQLKMSASRA